MSHAAVRFLNVGVFLVKCVTAYREVPSAADNCLPQNWQYLESRAIRFLLPPTYWKKPIEPPAIVEPDLFVHSASLY